MNKDLVKLIDVNFPDMGPITDKVVEGIKRLAKRRLDIGANMGYRMRTGRIWTDKAYAERRKKVYDTPLP